MALEANHPKNQHYVPQFLLRNFTDEKDRLFVFDKWTERTFNSGTRNVAAETGFYDFQDETGEEHSLEYFMRRLEGDAAGIIAGILDKKSLGHLSKNDRIILSVFAAVQQLRVKDARHNVKSLNEELRKELARRGFDAENVAPELDDTKVKRVALNNIRMAKDNAKHFYDKAWVLQQAPPGKRLYISDNPITLHNTVEVEGRGNLGLRCRGIEIYLPLSPEFSLLILCESMTEEFFRFMARLAAQEQLLDPCLVDIAPIRDLTDAIRTGDPILLVPANVDHQNSLQVNFASRFIISATDDFELVKEMIRDYPNLKHPRRFTVQ